MNQGFEVARHIGNNVASGFKEAKEQSAIDSILSSAMETEDPAVLQQSIGRILSQVSPERQKPAIQFITQRVEGIKQQKEKQQTQDAYRQQGFQPGFERLPPALQAQKSKEQFNQRQMDSIFGGNTGQNNGGFGQNSEGMPQNQHSQPQNQPQRSIKDLSNDELKRALSIPQLKETAKAELEERMHLEKLNQKRDLKSFEFDQGRAKKVLEKADELAETIQLKQSALNQMNEAVDSGALDYFSLNNLAELTGIEAFRDSKGAGFKTASKEFFLGNLARIKGGRPNQWIEQQVFDASSKVGRDKASNLISNRSLQNEIDLDQKFIQLSNEIYNDSMERTGRPPKDLAKQTQDKLKEYANEKESEMFNDMRAIRTMYDKKNEPFMPVKKGTVISDIMIDALANRFKNDESKIFAEMKKLGYVEE